VGHRDETGCCPTPATRSSASGTGSTRTALALVEQAEAEGREAQSDTALAQLEASWRSVIDTAPTRRTTVLAENAERKIKRTKAQNLPQRLDHEALRFAG
jgi:hypothetical protein